MKEKTSYNDDLDKPLSKDDLKGFDFKEGLTPRELFNSFEWKDTSKKEALIKKIILVLFLITIVGILLGGVLPNESILIASFFIGFITVLIWFFRKNLL
jgi:hypothetical protein